MFDGDGLRVTFDVTPAGPGSTSIQAVAVNSGLDDLTDFNLQVGGRGGGGLACSCAVGSRSLAV